MSRSVACTSAEWHHVRRAQSQRERSMHHVAPVPPPSQKQSTVPADPPAVSEPIRNDVTECLHHARARHHAGRLTVRQGDAMRGWVGRGWVRRRYEDGGNEGGEEGGDEMGLGSHTHTHTPSWAHAHHCLDWPPLKTHSTCPRSRLLCRLWRLWRLWRSQHLPPTPHPHPHPPPAIATGTWAHAL